MMLSLTSFSLTYKPHRSRGNLYTYKFNCHVCNIQRKELPMIKKLNFKFAINTMIVLLLGIIAFHFLVLTGVIPYHIVWGGRLGNPSEMRVFEIVSITVNLLILAIIAIKGGYLRPVLPERMLTIALWIIIVLFVLRVQLVDATHALNLSAGVS